MTLAEIKKNLIALLMKDIGIAINKFSSILNSDSSMANTMILKSSEYIGLKREIDRGTKPDNYITRRQNQLRATTLDLINDLEESDLDLVAVESFLKDTSNQKKDIVEPSNSGIYISYAWGGESEKIVDLLDAELQGRSLKVIRDKRDLGYKGSITEFMKDIGKGNKVIVIISKKYLESENCMFELTQVYENKDFAKRIFPIILADADIYKPLNRINYIKYWDGKIQELDQAIKSLERGTDVLDLNRELNNYGKIRVLFSDIAFILKDMNTLSPEIHQGQKFDTLYKMLSGD